MADKPEAPTKPTTTSPPEAAQTETDLRHACLQHAFATGAMDVENILSAAEKFYDFLTRKDLTAQPRPSEQTKRSPVQ